jgi:hypothetical protein
MFNLFKKKQAAAPSDLVFKSNEAAFQYACAYLSTSLENESPVLAIVLGVKNARDYCVKLSNSRDPSIPTESPEQLLDSGDISNICFQASATDRVGSLKKGDLVMYVAVAQLAAIGKGNMGGVLIAKVQPTYSMVHSGWRNA